MKVKQLYIAGLVILMVGALACVGLSGLSGEKLFAAAVSQILGSFASAVGGGMVALAFAEARLANGSQRAESGPPCSKA